MGWRQLIIWSSLKLFEQAVSKLQNLVRGKVFYQISEVFSFFPLCLDLPIKQTEFEMLQLYVQSGGLCYMYPSRLLNQIESSGCWKAYLEKDWVRNFGIACWNPAYFQGANLFWCFLASSLGSWFRQRLTSSTVGCRREPTMPGMVRMACLKGAEVQQAGGIGTWVRSSFLARKIQIVLSNSKIRNETLKKQEIVFSWQPKKLEGF